MMTGLVLPTQVSDGSCRIVLIRELGVSHFPRFHGWFTFTVSPSYLHATGLRRFYYREATFVSLAPLTITQLRVL